MKPILFCPRLLLVITFAIATGKKLQQLSTKSGGPEFAEAEEGEASQPTIQSQRSGKIWSPGTGKKVNTECCVLNLKGPPQALF